MRVMKEINHSKGAEARIERGMGTLTGKKDSISYRPVCGSVGGDLKKPPTETSTLLASFLGSPCMILAYYCPETAIVVISSKMSGAISIGIRVPL